MSGYVVTPSATERAIAAANRQPTTHEWHRVPLPAGVAAVCEPDTHLYVSPTSKCKVLVSHTRALGWHLSISHPWRHPTWEEIKSARYALIPDSARMTMDLPPESEFVNVHEHCFHLFQCACATERPR